MPTLVEAYHESIQALRKGAEQILSLGTFLQGGYFAAISLSNIRDADMPFWGMNIFWLPVLFWLISIILALSIQMPRIDEVNVNMSEEGRADLLRKRMYKLRRQLRAAHISLVCGMGWLMVNLIVYLTFVPVDNTP
jgi:hypothetical protein